MPPTNRLRGSFALPPPLPAPRLFSCLSRLGSPASGGLLLAPEEARARFTLQSLERAERPRFSSLFPADDARRLDPGRASERGSARSPSAPFCSSSPSRSERSPASGRRGLRLHLAPTCLAPSPCDLTAYYHTRPVRFHSDERARTVAYLMSLRQALGLRRKALRPQWPLYPAPWWLVGRASTCSRVPS